MKKEKNKGITLIALVITIIVMLILVVVVIDVSTEGGLIGKAQTARDETQIEAEREQFELAKAGAKNDLTGKIDIEKMGKELKGWTYKDGVWTSPNGNEITLEELEPEDDKLGVKVTIDGEQKILTKENYAEYLGKEVTNYVGKEQVTIDGTNYNVSTKYRLYYIDFENKYGDGERTVYLKADSSSNKYALTRVVTDNEKIKKFNPSLFAEGKTPPVATYGNMRSITWLLDTNNWENLKPNTEIAQKVNYVVGAPCIEMMIDSYNAHYNLTGESPDLLADLSGDKRTKLFYKYETETSGYQ